MLGIGRTTGSAVLAALVVLAAGCGGDGSSDPDDDGGVTDGGGGDGSADDGGGGDDGGSAGCFEPDTSCPDDAPHTGYPCEGDLECTYEGSRAGDKMFTCEDGEWSEVPCPGCPPQLFEACDAPFDGTLDGVAVMLGPAVDGPFREFEDGEEVTPVIGGQGSSMIAYRLELDDTGAPQCVRVRVRITIEGDEGPWNQHDIALHCGESLRIYEVLPFTPCEMRDYPTTLEVDVDGVGAATANIALQGGLCTG